MSFINKAISYLQEKNHKAFYLAFMRVALCFFLLKEILIKLPYLDTLYGNGSVFKFIDHSGFAVTGINTGIFRNNYQFIVGLYIAVLVLFMFGVGKRFSAFIIFALLLLLQKMNNSTINGGDKMVKLMMLYFVFANSFEYFAIKKKGNQAIASATDNLISNLAAYSLMIQLCLAYMVTFINKVNNPFWINGTANYYNFNTEAFQGTGMNAVLAHSPLFVYLSTYFTLLFEGSFAFLIWFKRCRIPLLIGGLSLHLGIYVFMMIYNLQIVFLLPYGFFFSNDEVIHFFKKRLRLNFLFKQQS